VEGDAGDELYGLADVEQVRPLSKPFEEHSKGIQPRDVVSAKPTKVRQTIEVVDQLRALGYIQ